MFQFKLGHWFHAAPSAAVGKRLLRLAPGMVWQRDSFGNALLELAEYLIEHPDALKGLGELRAQDGKRCASNQELEVVVQLLELVAPVH